MGIFAIMAVSATFNSSPLAAMLPKKIAPLIQLHFSVPDETKGWYGRCDDRKELERAWLRYHKKIEDGGGQPYPEIDFKKHMVVGICMKDSAAGVSILEVFEDSDQIRIHFRGGSIQTAPGAIKLTKEEEEAERIYFERQFRIRLTFVMLPATKKPIVFREAVAGNILGPWEFEERKVLHAPK